MSSCWCFTQVRRISYAFRLSVRVWPDGDRYGPGPKIQCPDCGTVYETIPRAGRRSGIAA